MEFENAKEELPTPRRGLATIAFLKARFDARVDHLDMFQPFVEHAILQIEKSDIEISDVVREVRRRTGLTLPGETVSTLLRRCTKKRLLERHGGRYFRKNKYSPSNVTESRLAELEGKNQQLGARLRQFAAEQGELIPSDDDALALLVNFLDTHHIGFVLDQSKSNAPASDISRADKVVAAFVALVVNEGGTDYATLNDIVKGFIIQNALLLRDIPIRRHFENLTVCLDTGILLKALGYAGHTERQNATEALELIRKAGARLWVFERTISEVVNILEIYEQRLATPNGLKVLRPTELTFNFLGIGATPADIRQELALMPSKLRNLQISTHTFPERLPEYTENEEALAGLLRDPTKPPGSDDDRVWHDVDAVAAIMTLRKGIRTGQVGRARYLFASGSSLTVSNVQSWYRESYPTSIQPMMHFRSLTNAAWILRPTRAPEAPIHQLITVCTAVLRPAESIWANFVTKLEDLVDRGEVNDDESIAVLASELTCEILSDYGQNDDLEADNVREIVERVRQTQEIDLRNQLEKTRRQRDEGEIEAQQAKRRAESIENSVRDKADRLAGWFSGMVYAVFGFVIVTGAAMTLPTNFSEMFRGNEVWVTLAWGCIFSYFVCSVLSIITPRFQMLNLYGCLKVRLTRLIRRVLLPTAEYELEGDKE